MEIPKELSPCVKKALSRLGIGDMTVGEMLDYLSDPYRKNTAFPPEVAERAVSLLIQEGFLDDKRYLRIVLRRLDARLFGPRRIREELVRHRFSPGYVKAALDRSVDYTKRAKMLLDKKPEASQMASTLPGRKKLMDYLARHGYDYGTAKAAVDRIGQGCENCFD